MATYTYQLETSGSDGPSNSRTGATAVWAPVDGVSGTEDFDGTAQEYAATVLENWFLDEDEEGSPRKDDCWSYRVLAWDGPEPGGRDKIAATATWWGATEVQLTALREHLIAAEREHQRQLQALARLAPVNDLADLLTLLDGREALDADSSLLLGVAIEVLREKSPAAQAAARAWMGQVHDNRLPGTSLAAAVAAAARAGVSEIAQRQRSGASGQDGSRPVRILVRGASPLQVMTWARVSAVPRPGDVITIEDDGEGRAYTVTGIQFDLRPREGTGGGQERVLVEEAIVVHVMLPGA